MRGVSTDQRASGPVVGLPSQAGPGGRRWVAPVIYGLLGLEVAGVIVFAVLYNALDFRIYMSDRTACPPHM